MCAEDWRRAQTTTDAGAARGQIFTDKSGPEGRGLHKDGSMIHHPCVDGSVIHQHGSWEHWGSWLPLRWEKHTHPLGRAGGLQGTQGGRDLPLAWGRAAYEWGVGRYAEEQRAW